MDSRAVASRAMITAMAMTGPASRWTNTATNSAEKIGALRPSACAGLLPQQIRALMDEGYKGAKVIVALIKPRTTSARSLM
jgi:hypothetical protein